MLDDPEYRRDGFSPLRCALVEDDTGPRGYVLFAAKRVWRDDIPEHELAVRELFAVDPAAYAKTWAHVLDRDLVGVVTADNRPIDDPLLHLLADSRRARVRQSDGLWIRLVAVGAALAARVYACPVDVAVDVDDPVCPWNTGRWRLSGDASGAVCAPTTDPADLAVPVAVLGAAYLGGTRLGGFAGAGLVREFRAGALRALSAALAWDPAPWCPVIFSTTRTAMVHPGMRMTVSAAMRARDVSRPHAEHYAAAAQRVEAILGDGDRDPGRARDPDLGDAAETPDRGRGGRGRRRRH